MTNRGADDGSAAPPSIDTRDTPDTPRRLESTASRLLRTIDALTEGLLVQDHSGAIIDCNPATERLLGLTADQIAGRAPRDPGWRAIHEDGTPFPDDEFPAERTRIHGTTHDEVIMGVHKPGGTLTWLAITAIPFRISDHDRLGVLCTIRNITMRKRAEAAAQEGRVRLELAARAGEVGFWDWDVVTNQAVYSPEWKRQLGYEPHEIGNHYTEWERRLHPDDHDRAVAGVRAYLSGETTEYEVEFRLRHKDGSYRWIFARGDMERDAAGKPRRVVGCHIDITERKAAERAMLESRQRYANLVDSIEGIVWEADAATLQFTYVSDRAEAILGYTCAEWLSHPTFWADHLHPDDRDQAVRFCLEQVARGDAHDFEYRMIAKSGEAVWIREMADVVVEPGQPTLLRGLMLDITARRQAQAAVLAQKERLMLAMELASLGHWEFIPATRHIALDDAFLGLLHATIDDLGGRTLHLDEYVRRFLTADATVTLTAALQDAMDAPGLEHTRQLEHQMRCTDGSLLTVSVRFVLVKDAAGNLVKCYGIIQDISARKAIETRLMRLLEGESLLASISQRFIEMDLAEFDRVVIESIQRIAEFVGAVRANLFLYAPDGRLLNPYEWCLDPADSLAADVENLKAGDYGFLHEQLKALRVVQVQSIDDVPEGTVERRWVDEHGFRPMVLVPVASRARLIGVFNVYGRWRESHTFDQDLIAVLGSFATSLAHVLGRRAAEEERVFLERQLFQSQKLEAIGTLAGGIAHDFNNILTAIVGNVELARMDAESGLPVDGSLVEIETAADRATALVQQILAFSRHHQHERRVIALPAVVAEAVRLVRATIPAVVAIDVAVGQNVPHVLADPTQMHQILINLCANAWHAMGDDPGTIAIAVDGVTLTANEAARIGGIAAGPCARVTVRDNGCGMDEELMRRIFEPFFTTKPVGKGTGLGMSVVFGIVRTHQGGITVDSAVGRGTTVRVFIPAASAPIDTDEPVVTTVLGQGERLLIIDDETALARVMSQALERLGYRVTAFSEPAEALAVFQRDPSAFDLVIADYEMPDVTGLAVASALLRIRPDAPIVLWSGRFSPDIHGAAREAGIRRLIMKPCEPSEISRVIRDVLIEARTA